MRVEKKRLFRPSKRDQFLEYIAQGFDFDTAEILIDQFLDDTFLDAPDGKPSRPYVCSIAWMEYSMASKPFGWSREYTLDQPLRVIYQLLRCRAIDSGMKVINRISDTVLQKAINETNTPEAMAKRAAEMAAFSERYRQKIQRENSYDDETGSN